MIFQAVFDKHHRIIIGIISFTGQRPIHIKNSDTILLWDEICLISFICHLAYIVSEFFSRIRISRPVLCERCLCCLWCLFCPDSYFTCQLLFCQFSIDPDSAFLFRGHLPLLRDYRYLFVGRSPCDLLTGPFYLQPDAFTNLKSYFSLIQTDTFRLYYC